MDEFTKHYLVASLWASNDEDGIPLDDNYCTDDFGELALAQAEHDCKRFQEENQELLANAYIMKSYNEYLAGYDFWLSRNGHGAGFFDRGLDKLQEAAMRYSELNVIVGDDGKLYFD